MQWSDMDWTKGTPLAAGTLSWGLVQTTPETAVYWEKIKDEGRIYLKRCIDCSAYNHPRRLVCTGCYGMHLEWAPASGRGTVYSFSTVHHAPSEDAEKELPYTLGIVNLEEGVPFFGKIEDAGAGEVAIDAPVGAVVRQVFGQMLPVFLVGT